MCYAPTMPNMLITGGARGIGRATAILAAERGWSVAIGYATDETAARETLGAVEALGRRGCVIGGDVADEQQVIAMFNQASSQLGGLDAVVINAGIVGPSMLLADMDAERIRKMFAVNTVGAMLCAREAVRRMATSRGGRGGSLTFVASRAAQLGSPFEYVDYAASKGAIDTLTIGLAKEAGPRAKAGLANADGPAGNG